MPDQTYEDRRNAIRRAIVLGIDAEAHDIDLCDIVAGISDEQVDWLASWLASEGMIIL